MALEEEIKFGFFTEHHFGPIEYFGGDGESSELDGLLGCLGRDTVSMCASCSLSPPPLTVLMRKDLINSSTHSSHTSETNTLRQLNILQGSSYCRESVLGGGIQGAVMRPGGGLAVFQDPCCVYLLAHTWEPGDETLQ